MNDRTGSSYRLHTPSSQRRLWPLLILLTVVCYATSAWSILLTREAGNVAVIWPLNAFLLAAALMLPHRRWHAVLGCGFIASIAANRLSGSPLVVDVGQSVVNVVEVWVAATLIRRRSSTSRLFVEGRQIALFSLVAGVIVPAIGATLGASMTAGLSDAAFGSVLVTWFAADALGYLTITPIVVLGAMLARNDRAILLFGRRTREATALLAAVLAVSLVVFSQHRLPLLFLPIPFVLLATFRLGPFGAAASTLIVAAVGACFSLLDMGPVTLIDGPHTARIQFFQFYVAAVFVTALPLGSLLAEREKMAAELRASEIRYRSAVEYVGEAIFQTDAKGRWTFLNPAWEHITGHSVASSLGRSFLSSIQPDDRQRALDNLAPLHARQIDACRQKLRYLAADGSTRWTEVQSRLILDENGEIVGTAGSLRDITQHHLAEAALADSERRFRTLSEAAPAGIFRTDAEGCVTYVNETWCRLSGLTAEQAMGHGWLDALPPEDRAYMGRAWENARAGRTRPTNEQRFVHADGRVVWSTTVFAPERDESDAIVGYIGVVFDITAAKQAEAALVESEARYRLLAENATDVVIQFDLENVCRYVSPSVREIAGFEPDHFIGVKLFSAVHPDDQPTLQKAHAEIVSGISERAVFEYRTKHADGRWLWLEANLRALHDPTTGIVTGVVGSIRDIGKRKALEAQLIAARDRAEAVADDLYILAITDELTGLANRRHFLTRLDAELDRAARQRQPLALALFDVDHFKRINDKHGHGIGDEVLRAIGAVCHKTMRTVDLVGRLGGEEFGIILPASDLDAASAACERLRNAIAAQRIALPDGSSISITVSVGIALLHDDETASRFLKRADDALYQAKEAGRDRLRVAA